MSRRALCFNNLNTCDGIRSRVYHVYLTTRSIRGHEHSYMHKVLYFLEYVVAIIRVRHPDRSSSAVIVSIYYVMHVVAFIE